MIKLENKKYRVCFSTQGAEVTSFYDKDLEIEYMWQGDEKYWAGRNPILFPVIGSSYDKQYHFNGRTTTMGNHGILRNAPFELVKADEDEVIFEFNSDDESFRKYPFYFRLEVIYTLHENELKIAYRIYNEGVVDLPCNFGLHPGFNCPLEQGKSFEDYKLVFASKEVLRGDGPSVTDGLVKEIDLNYDLFKEYPTFLYYGLNSPYLGYTDGTHGVDVSIVGFPVTAVWTQEAPFICLEPWNGRSRIIDKDLPFVDRDATMIIGPERNRLFTYTISVH